MIKELSRFVEDIPEQVRALAIEPKTGLHILISIDENGERKVLGYEKFTGKKHGVYSSFLEKCAKLQDLSWMVDTNKCFDLPAKGIHTASPFAVGFKRESWIGGKKDINAKTPLVNRLDTCFEKCFDEKYQLTEHQKQKAVQLRDFIKNDLNTLLTQISDFENMDEGEYIIVYLDIDPEEYQNFNSLYLVDKLFNTDAYNIKVDNVTFGTSNFFNGFNSKKPFLIHHTASFDITGRVSAAMAKNLEEFKKLAAKRLFPNPLPIFIDNSELTNQAINFWQREENKKPSHRDIIKELYKKEETLGNYYLVYYAAGSIRDFDFVPKFRYNLSADQSPWVIKNAMELTRNKLFVNDLQLYSVFDFEREVVRPLFNNALFRVDDKKGTVSLRYFDDLDAKYYRAAMFTLILKYRKPVYDFIYKSMGTVIGPTQFRDICLTGIIDDVKQDNSYGACQKLNIFFSLYQYFENSDKNHHIMPSYIEENKKRLSLILENDEEHFSSDEEYAFGSGQLIYYLLSKSEAGEKTHALLEPFLQKTNLSTFNDALVQLIARYKHALGFNFKKFNNLASEVLGFNISQGQSISSLKPFMLAGYFCPNVLYKKKEVLTESIDQ